eukprot:jgi/Mesvir1/16567/Mv10107-RA.1
MYFSYGWPKVMQITVGGEETGVHLSYGDGYFVLVTSSLIQVWSGTQHCVKLGEVARDRQSLEEDGINRHALWQPDTSTVAVLTDKNTVLLFLVEVLEEQLLPDDVVADGSRDKGLRSVSVSLRSKIFIKDDTVSCLSLEGDADSILVGLSSGMVLFLSWKGARQGLLDLCANDMRLPGSGEKDPLEPVAMFYSLGAVADPAAASNKDKGSLAAQPQKAGSKDAVKGGQRESDGNVGVDAARMAPSGYGNGIPVSHAQGDGSRARGSWDGGHRHSQQKGPPVHARSAVRQVEYSDVMGLFAAVLASGSVALCTASERGLLTADTYMRKRWLSSREATCTAITPRAQVLAVGTRDGTVDLYDVSDSRADLLRSVSILDWGYTPADTGPVRGLAWTPDGWAFAVRWRRRGLAVWSISGCRLMCTLRRTSGGVNLGEGREGVAGGEAGVAEERSGSSRVRRGSGLGSVCGWVEARFEKARPGEHEGGGGADQDGSQSGSARGLDMTGRGGMCWGAEGYRLVVVEDGPERGGQMLVFPFAKGCMTSAVAQNTHVWQMLQAEDRLMLIQSDENEELQVQHLLVPYSYMATNWPLQHVAANDDSTDIAVAGRNGVALYNPRSKKWRVFGDVMQERAIRCVGLMWFHRTVVLCNHRPDNRFELLFYPHYHLDESSLLYRLPLKKQPLALDVCGQYLLVATPPLEIRVYHVRMDGELSPLGSPSVHMTMVRDLSIMTVRKPPVSMRFVPKGTLIEDALPEPWSANNSSSAGVGLASGTVPSAPVTPDMNGPRGVSAQPPAGAVTGNSISQGGRGIGVPVGPHSEDEGVASHGVVRAAPDDAQLQGGSERPGRGRGDAHDNVSGTSMTSVVAASSASPVKCMVLRTDGELSLLDLEQGSERALLEDVEHFWLTVGRPKADPWLVEELPWWAYGHRGMQLWFPTVRSENSHHGRPFGDPSAKPPGGTVMNGGGGQLDPELEFDREVTPLGISPAVGVIVGVSQRMSFAPLCSQLPCFEPMPSAQPILPCLLRHLLQRDALDEAIQVARLFSVHMHFSHSLEWLLFTVLDAEVARVGALRKAGSLMALPSPAKEGATGKKPGGGIPAAPSPMTPGFHGSGAGGSSNSLLYKASELIRNFPIFADVVVSVARKTDERHWALLFEAAGKPTLLFDECFTEGLYRTATCYILVIDKLEGATVGQQKALLLLQATLEEKQYDLAGELVRFLVRSGREYSTAEAGEGKPSRTNSEGSMFSSFFHFGLSSGGAPKNPAQRLHRTVKHTLNNHALSLLRDYDLLSLVAFAKGTHFNLTDFFSSQKANSSPPDFTSALTAVYESINLQLLQARLDLEFLLAHVNASGCTEWTLVLATLLQRRALLRDLFKGAPALWAGYQKTVQAAPCGVLFKGLLEDVSETIAPGDST